METQSEKKKPRGGSYCCAGVPDKVICTNGSYKEGISMHKFKSNIMYLLCPFFAILFPTAICFWWGTFSKNPKPRCCSNNRRCQWQSQRERRMVCAFIIHTDFFGTKKSIYCVPSERYRTVRLRTIRASVRDEADENIETPPEIFHSPEATISENARVSSDCEKCNKYQAEIRRIRRAFSNEARKEIKRKEKRSKLSKRSWMYWRCELYAFA